MKDYLLRFKSKEQAVAFGRMALSEKARKVGEVSKYESAKHAEENGVGIKFVADDEKGAAQTTLATHAYAIYVIGPWMRQAGEDKEGNPIVESDGLHWVLFRDLVGLKIPPGADKFIFWTSDDGKRPENCPQVEFAGDGNHG